MKKRKPTMLGVVGAILLGGGVIGVSWESLLQFSPGRIGAVSVLLGALAVVFAKLNAKNLAADEIFNLGRERGEGDAYDEGYRDGLEEGRRSLPRPTVVPLHQRCEDCGGVIAKTLARSVVDRG